MNTAEQATGRPPIDRGMHRPVTTLHIYLHTPYSPVPPAIRRTVRLPVVDSYSYCRTFDN
jgi:hypothetical protein